MLSGKQEECLSFISNRNTHKYSVHINVMDFLDLEVLTSQAFLLGMLEGQKPSGLSKGFLTPKGQRGRKVQLFLPLLL